MPSKRTAKFLDAQNFLYELNQRWIRESEALEKHKAENGKDRTYYMLLGKQDGIKTALEMAEDFVNGNYAVQY